jgi:hypothetical protein
VHSYPGATTGVWSPIGGMLSVLRTVFYSVAFSWLACQEVKQHLAGSVPIAEWSTLKEVRTRVTSCS